MFYHVKYITRARLLIRFLTPFVAEPNKKLRDTRAKTKASREKAGGSSL
jgi:hypothetical protein